MTVAEKISICLGLLSVGLALYAIGQAYFYKKQLDKQACSIYVYGKRESHYENKKTIKR